MNFQIQQAIEVLERTPGVLAAFLAGLSDGWTASTGNTDKWQPYDIVGHLIHAEKTDWIPRARIILGQQENVTFEPFDRFAQFNDSKGKSIGSLLGEFAEVRKESLLELTGWQLTPAQLDLGGIHPELGRVKLSELLATWVVHDLTHIRQIAMVMADRYRDDVGVWREYLSILK